MGWQKTRSPKEEERVLDRGGHGPSLSALDREGRCEGPSGVLYFPPWVLPSPPREPAMCTFVWCRTSFVCAAVRVACGLRCCGDREGLNFTFTFTVEVHTHGHAVREILCVSVTD